MDTTIAAFHFYNHKGVIKLFTSNKIARRAFTGVASLLLIGGLSVSPANAAALAGCTATLSNSNGVSGTVSGPGNCAFQARIVCQFNSGGSTGTIFVGGQGADRPTFNCGFSMISFTSVT